MRRRVRERDDGCIEHPIGKCVRVNKGKRYGVWMGCNGMVRRHELKLNFISIHI